MSIYTPNLVSLSSSYAHMNISRNRYLSITLKWVEDIDLPVTYISIAPCYPCFDIFKGYRKCYDLRSVCRPQEVTECCGCISCSKETRDTFAEMMNFSLLKDVIFVIFSVSNFCTSIGFNVPYLYVVSQAETLNIGKSEASYLIASIGVANTIGRIILGYIADKPWVNRLLVYNVCLTACGIGKSAQPSFSSCCLMPALLLLQPRQWCHCAATSTRCSSTAPCSASPLAPMWA